MDNNRVIELLEYIKTFDNLDFGAKNHRVVCKCCGHSRMKSSAYIDPYSEEEWIKF